MNDYYCYGCNNCCYINESDLEEQNMLDDDLGIIDTWCPCGGVRT